MSLYLYDDEDEYEICPECDGTGMDEHCLRSCYLCDGAGEVTLDEADDYFCGPEWL